MESTAPRTRSSVLALALACALIVGIPFFFLGWPSLPFTTAALGAGLAIVTAAVVLGAGWLTRSWAVPEYLRWLAAALLCGGVISLVALSPDAFASAAVGLMFVLPLIAVVVTIAYIIDREIRRNALLQRVLTILGVVFIAGTTIAALTLQL